MGFLRRMNVKGTVDGEADKPGSAADGKHVHDPSYHYKKKAVQWVCAQRTKPRKELIAWDG